MSRENCEEGRYKGFGKGEWDYIRSRGRGEEDRVAIMADGWQVSLKDKEKKGLVKSCHPFVKQNRDGKGKGRWQISHRGGGCEKMGLGKRYCLKDNQSKYQARF